MATTEPMCDEWVLQDSRAFVGNAVLWWAKNGHGYTTNLDEAHIFTEREAREKQRSRKTDVPWPYETIAKLTKPTVDMQNLPKRV